MAIVRRGLVLGLALVAMVLLFVGGWLVGRLGIGSVVDPGSLTELERQFADRMQNTTMVGTFTVAGREGRTPRPDRYGDRYAGTWQHGEVGGPHVGPHRETRRVGAVATSGVLQSPTLKYSRGH